LHTLLLPTQPRLSGRTFAFAARIFAVLFISFLFLFPSSVQAVANSVIGFQSKIVNKTTGLNVVTSSPACVAGGADTCDFRANIYTDPAAGTLLWREPHANVEIGATGGYFNLQLNSVCTSWTAPGGSCSGTGIVWGADSTVYIEIEMDTDGDGDFATGGADTLETFSRKLFTSVPYAYYADSAGTVNGLADTDFVKFAPASGQTTASTNTLINLTTTANTANPLFFLNENGAGTPDLLQVQVAGVNQLLLSNAGQLQLATTGTGAGLLIGGDAQLYRSAADTIRTPDSLIVDVNSSFGTTTATAFGNFGAATTGKASLRIVSSATVNPSAPNSGDLWWNGTNFYFYNGSISVDLLGGACAACVSFSTGTTQTSTDTDALIDIATTGNVTNPLIRVNENGAGTPSLLDLQIGGTSTLVHTNAGQLQLAVTGSNGGILLGGDAQIYRSAADILRTPDSLIVDVNSSFGTTTATAFGTFGAATTSKASLRLVSSAATNPASPNSGDLWWNGTNLYFNDGSTNRDLLAAATKTIQTRTVLCTKTFASAGEFDTTNDCSGLNSTYSDLEINIKSRSTNIGPGFQEMYMLFNNDTTTSNYVYQNLYGLTTTAAASNTSTPYIATIPDAATTAGSFGNTKISIPRYRDAQFKNSQGFWTFNINTVNDFVGITSHSWENTAAITRITLRIDTAPTDQFAIGTYVELIGIKEEAVAISGGGGGGGCSSCVEFSVGTIQTSTDTDTLIDIATTGNVTNPLIRINENGAGTPSLLQVQVAGSNAFSIANSSQVSLASLMSTPTTPYTILGRNNLAGNFCGNGTFGCGLLINEEISNFAASGGYYGIYTNLSNTTSGATANFLVGGVFTAQVNNTMTQSGGLQGTSQIINSSGSVTISGNSRGIYAETGTLNAGTKTIADDMGIVVRTAYTGGTATITRKYGLKFDNNTTSGGLASGNYTAAAITDYYGIYHAAPVNGTITNLYGIYLENQTQGTNDYGVYIGGADTYAIWSDSGANRFDGNVLAGTTTNTAFLNVAPSTTGQASMRLVSSAGTNPSAPNSGDLWWNGTNLFFYNGTSIDLLGGTCSACVAFSTGSVQTSTDTDALIDIATTGSVTNPVIRVNENGAGTPNLLQLQVAGSSAFNVANSSQVSLATLMSAPATPYTIFGRNNLSGNFCGNGSFGCGILINEDISNFAASGGYYGIYSVIGNHTSGATANFVVGGHFGVEVHNTMTQAEGFAGISIIANTSGSVTISGNSRGIYAESGASGAGTKTITDDMGIIVRSAYTGGTSTITRKYGIKLDNNTTSGGLATGNFTSAAIATYYGLYHAAPVNGTITTGYGIYVENMTQATNDYGIYIGGADTYAIWSDSGVNRFDGNVLAGTTTNTAFLTVAEATTGQASLRLLSSAGTNPSSPNSGDLWWNGTNLNFRTGSSTVDLLGSPGPFVFNTSGTAIGLELIYTSSGTTADAISVINSSTGVITDAIDVSDAEILNALNIGENNIVQTNGGTVNWNDSSGNNLIRVTDIATNFGASVEAGAMVSLNSYFGEEFMRDRAASTADTAFNYGDFQQWTVDEEANGTNDCQWDIVTDSINGIMRMETVTIATDTACLIYPGTSPGNPHTNQIVSNLPLAIMKVMPSHVGANDKIWVGMSTTVLDDGNDPNNGIWFTNVTGTTWTGITASGGTQTTVTCTGQTISTTQFALLKIEVRSSTDVRFYVDNDVSNGINWFHCGTSTGNIPAGAMAQWMKLNSTTIGHYLDVDYYRNWQDDAAPRPESEIAAIPAEGEEVSGDEGLVEGETLDSETGAEGEVVEEPVVEPEPPLIYKEGMNVILAGVDTEEIRFNSTRTVTLGDALIHGKLEVAGDLFANGSLRLAGNLFMSAEVTGRELISPTEAEFSMVYAQPRESIANLIISLEDSRFEYRVIENTETGFRVEVIFPETEEEQSVYMSWITVHTIAAVEPEPPVVEE
jgi:hypothetical protein